MTASRRRVVLTAVALLAMALFGCIAWVAYRVSKIDISEAYAAEDSAKLLIAYMEANDDRWPKSWDDLDTFLQGEAGRFVPFRGTQTGDRQRAKALRQRVAIDWTFEPAVFREQSVDIPKLRVVTRIDGSDFETVWEGA